MGVVKEAIPSSSGSQRTQSRSLDKTATKRKLAIKQPWRSLSMLAHESAYVPLMGGAVLLGELALSILVIRYVRCGSQHPANINDSQAESLSAD